jgi:hypothetical protein
MWAPIRGCQIFLDTMYQNLEKYTKSALNYQNGHKIYPMAVIYSKWTWNIPTISISRPSKIYPNWNLWFENIPSGNPAPIWSDFSFRFLLGHCSILARIYVGNNHFYNKKRFDYFFFFEIFEVFPRYLCTYSQMKSTDTKQTIHNLCWFR